MNENIRRTINKIYKYLIVACMFFLFVQTIGCIKEYIRIELTKK